MRIQTQVICGNSNANQLYLFASAQQHRFSMDSTTKTASAKVYIVANFCRWLSAENKQEAERHFVELYNSTAPPLTRNLHTHAFKFNIANRDEFIAEVLQGLFLKLQGRVARREQSYSRVTELLGAKVHEIPESWQGFTNKWLDDAWLFCRITCTPGKDVCEEDALELDDRFREIKIFLHELQGSNQHSETRLTPSHLTKSLSILRIPTFPFFLAMAKNESIAFSKNQSHEEDRFGGGIDHGTGSDGIDDIPDDYQEIPEEIEAGNAFLNEQIQELFNEVIVTMEKAVNSANTSQKRGRAEKKLLKEKDHHETYWKIIKLQYEENYTLGELSELLELSYDQTRTRVDKMREILAPLIPQRSK